jgi:hypothetical protein
VLDQTLCAINFISTGNISIVDYLLSLNFHLSADLASAAAEHNHFELLKFLHDNGCRFDINILQAAAVVGNLDMVKYILAHGGRQLNSDAKKGSAQLCAGAAGGGNVQLLKYLHEHGYE